MDSMIRTFGAVTKAKDNKHIFLASNETRDRHGTIIKMDAWDLKNFKNNPIMAYQHETSGGWITSADPDSIIGTWDVWIEGKELLVAANYEPKDLNEKADLIRRKVEHGTLRAVSVGFIPKKGHWGEEKEEENVNIFYYDEVELLEVSIVNIPSNPDSMKRNTEVEDEFLKKYPKPTEELEFEFKTEKKGMSVIQAKTRILSL